MTDPVNWHPGLVAQALEDDAAQPGPDGWLAGLDVEDLRRLATLMDPVDTAAPMEVACQPADHKTAAPSIPSFGGLGTKGAEGEEDATRATTSGASPGARATFGPAGDDVACHETTERPGAAPAEGTRP